MQTEAPTQILATVNSLLSPLPPSFTFYSSLSSNLTLSLLSAKIFSPMRAMRPAIIIFKTKLLNASEDQTLVSELLEAATFVMELTTHVGLTQG